MKTKIIILELASYFLLLLGVLLEAWSLTLKFTCIGIAVIIAIFALVYDNQRSKTKYVIFPIVAYSSYQVITAKAQTFTLTNLLPNFLMLIFLILLGMWLYALNGKK
ncbi:hypothetical protein [uncultured Rummeliibacillus sp.]|uniref:hypothetical protein n=1 Tax=uncultured Rummeliibacillus sp. TaxID=762292 RepID=UPI002615C066|nr:hypothetical protein [uncultured Rummeliibacillus sp.]